MTTRLQGPATAIERQCLRMLAALLACAGWLPVAASPLSSTMPAYAPILKHYGVAEGLPQSGINALVQTRDGYLWVGTFGGLARFDGSRFTLFPAGRGDTATDHGSGRGGAQAGGPSSDRILSLHEDNGGRLWIGTQDGGLSVLDQGRFSTLPICEQQCMVSDLRQDPQETLWATTDVGIYRVNPVTHASSLLLQSRDRAYNLLERTADGSIHAGGHDGLARISNGAFVPIALPYGATRVNALEADGNDLLVATDAGLLRHATTRGTWMHASDRTNIHGIHVSDATTTWRFADNGELWIQRDGMPGEQVTLPAPIITTALQSDHEGNLWVGTHNRGILRLTHPWIGLLSDPVVGMQSPGRSVIGDGDGGFWFGMGCDGLRHWQADRRLQQIPLRISASENGCVSSLLREPDGALLVGMTGGRLGRLQHGRLSLLATFPGQASIGIWQAADGQRYVAAATETFKLGSRASVASGASTPVAVLTGMRTAFMADARNGGIWSVGNRGAIRVQDDRIVEQWISGQHPSMRFARSLHEDEDGVLWIGTYGGGLNRIQDGTLINYRQRDGLFDDTVSCILSDSEGRLWLGGNRGISMITREQRRSGAAHIKTSGFTEVDGLTPSEINGGTQSACHRDASGRLWFSLVEGFAVIDPRKAAPPVQRTLPVHIEQISINGQPMAPSERVVLDANSDTIEIAFTAVNLTTPEQTQFRLRMSGSGAGPGAGDDWIDSGRVRSVLYPHVPWGEHLFEVQARNEGDPWPKDTARLWISRPMPWHQRPWIWLLSTFLGLVVLFAGYRSHGDGNARHRIRLARLRSRLSTSGVDARR